MKAIHIINNTYYHGVVFFMLVSVCNAQSDSIDYLGQSAPGYYPKKFAAEFFKINDWGPVFSPDGNELFYTWQTPNMTSQIYHINYMKKTDGVWSDPVPAPFTDINGSAELEPNFSPDGKRLYFDSERQGGFGGADIWYVEKTDTGWSKPVNAGAIINSIHNDNFASFAEDGSLFFCSDRNKSEWDIDIYYAKFDNGNFSAPVRLGDSINTTYWDACPTIVNGKLFYESRHSDGFGSGDIYFSQITGNNFGKAELMSANFNTNRAEFGLVLSPDKKYLFFSHSKEAGVYWVDAEALNYYGVKQEPFNYITSWYAGDSAQMKQALHPELKKRRVISMSDVRNVTYNWMISATQSCTGCIDTVKKGQKDIQILDQTDAMASVKILSNEYTDYLHLAKFNNQWKIVNVLWEYKTTNANGTCKEAEQLVNDYIDGWKTKDTAVMRSVLLPDFAGRTALSLSEVENVDYNWMVDDIKNCEDTLINTATTIETEVLDTSNNMASVKVSYDEYVEYLHLTYQNNKWFIVNSLRDFKITSQGTGTEAPENNSGIIIYPNPNNGQFTVSLGVPPVRKARIKIVNVQGTLVYNKIIHNTPIVSFDLTDFSEGTYVVKIIADGREYEKKVLKQY